MRIIIIGSVAAGTSVAAKARRNSEECEIVIYEKDRDISYSACGLPYYIGQKGIKRSDLTPRDSCWFKKRFNMDVKTGHEVLTIDPARKSIEVKDYHTGEIFEDFYDKLVIATGASPIKPDITGLDNDNVFAVRNIESADKIIGYIAKTSPKKAVIIGGGYIGLELLENLINRGIDVVLVEREKSLAGKLDRDISIYLEEYLKEKKIKFLLGEEVSEIADKKVITKSGKSIEADFVVSCTGVHPNSKLAEDIGIETFDNGAIKINHKLETNIEDIYAVGDVAMAWSLINGAPMYVPLGSTANKMGRICGDIITGGALRFKGILGTGIFKVFEMAVAQTGMTEAQAKNFGYDIEVIHNLKPNQTEYFEESREMVIKAVADRKSSKILGVQIVGARGVDKRIDVFVSLMSLGATVDQLFHLDLAYAPPFSTTKDPVMYTGMVLDNAINGRNKIITPEKLIKERDDYIVIDVRSPKQYGSGHIPGAVNIPLEKLRNRSEALPKTEKYVVHCNKGVSGNAAHNIMLNMGFDCYNLSGGYKNFKIYTQLSK
ncbi:FAD-dependent oxidoreductase [uncultured Ilyobacter sp.]|uniref:FAD-dependent oxidoreductase n=1 Tax=uncultured Ilyobacter sp. TaxID=544433 RepID=UPI002AA91E02|nr:FAD-dependent oxidoreductase [uncultured Ilyobacter sp.]